MILPLTGAAASLSVSLPEDLTGTIGSSWVSMRLARPRGALALWRCRLGLATDCDPKSVDGVYRYERYQDDILLEGKLQRDGQLTLTEYSVPGQLSTGRFIGTLTAAGYRGQWESTDGKRTVDFDLHVQGKAAPLNGQQLQTIDNENQERALQAIEQKDYARAIYWLQIARLRGSMLDTEPLQAAFTAVLAGQTHEWKAKLSACDPKQNYDCVSARPPLAFLAALEGDLAGAKAQFRELCRPQIVSEFHAGTLLCLAYAHIGEQMHDRTAALEGYDWACRRSHIACEKAWGANEKELIEAIRTHRQDETRKLLEKPLNLNAMDGEVLDAAVMTGDLALVRQLVEKGASPDVGSSLRNAAMNSSKENFEEIAEFLLDHGAKPGELAFTEAVGQGSEHLVSKMLAKGADVNAGDYVNWGTGLIIAAGNDDLTMVKLLLDHGADPTLEAKFVGTAMDATKNPEIKAMLTKALAECRNGTRRCESMSRVKIIRR